MLSDLLRLLGVLGALRFALCLEERVQIGLVRRCETRLRARRLADRSAAEIDDLVPGRVMNEETEGQALLGGKVLAYV